MKPLHAIEDKFDPSISTLERTPFPAQPHVIQGLINGF